MTVLITANEWLLGKSECGGFSSQEDRALGREAHVHGGVSQQLGLRHPSVLAAWGRQAPESLGETKVTPSIPQLFLQAIVWMLET